MFLKSVIQSLARHKVKYALVGGYAVSLYGAVRGTVDIDLVVALDLKNLRNAEKALVAIGLQSRLPVTADDIFQFRDEYIQNRNMAAWSFVNPEDPVEMVDVVIVYDLKDLKTVRKRPADFVVHMVTIEDLIRMKEESDRPQDREDVKALRKLL